MADLSSAARLVVADGSPIPNGRVVPTQMMMKTLARTAGVDLQMGEPGDAGLDTDQPLFDVAADQLKLYNGVSWLPAPFTSLDWLTDIRQNLRFWGAKGDGATDDTAAIQAWLDWGAAKGGLYAPAGTYLFTEIVIRSREVYILGAGRNITVFKQTSANVDGIRFAMNDTGNTYYRWGGLGRLTLTTDNADPTAGSLLRLERPRNFLVYDVEIIGGYRAVDILSPGVPCVLKDCYIAYQNFTASPGGTSCGVRVSRLQTTSADANAVQDPVDSLYYALGYSVFLDTVDIWGAGDFGWEYGLLINHIDGLVGTNCHIGRAELAQIGVKCLQQNLLCQNINFSNSQLDPAPEVTNRGHNGILYESDGLVARILRDHNYSNITILGANRDGIKVDEEVAVLNITGGEVKNAGDWSVRVNAGENVCINGLVSRNPDQNATGAGHLILNGGVSFIDGFKGFGAGLTGGLTAGAGATCSLENVGIYGSSNPFLIADGVTILGVSGLKSDRSAIVASASDLAVPVEHDVVYVTGTTNINRISGAWQGRQITLIFDDALTVVNNQSTSGAYKKFRLNADFVTSARDSLSLAFMDNGTVDIWYETSRSLN